MNTEPKSCNHPPALTEEALWEALEATAGADVMDHLADCPYCAVRLAALRRFGGTLRARLYRHDCPTVDALGDYVLGLLDKAAARKVEEHLQTCARCTGEVRSLTGFLTAERAPAPQASLAQADDASRDDIARLLAQGIRRVIATLLPPEPALALRGSDDVRRVVAETPHERILLETARRGEVCEMTGQLIADDDSAWQGALVEIHQGGRLTATAVLDELNEFACPQLQPLTARLTITSADGQQIEIDNLQLAT